METDFPMTEAIAERRPSLRGPFATVFLASAAIMAVELVAGRLISPYLGMSLYTWTAVIAVIMAGMSMGNYGGGRLADRLPPERALVVLLFVSAAAVLLLLPINAVLGGFPALQDLSWPARIFAHTGLLFFAPAMCLGAVAPVVAKMALTRSRATGRAVGGVFACSVLGSIAGTFLTGFWLVYLLGVRAILVLCAVGLASLALPFLRRWNGPGMHNSVCGAVLPDAADGGARVTGRLWPHYVTVFTSNAAFMALELAASRLLAREFGASLYTWTTIIGVVLAGVSLGNMLGGRLADRWPGRRTLRWLFLLAALSTLAAPVCARWAVIGLQSVFALMALSWPLQILFYTSSAFFLPCVIIGCISPVVAKRALLGNPEAGRVVGAVYAWGAVGGIAGTMASGYFLVAALGALPLVLLTALVLAAAALAYGPRRPAAWLGGALAAAAFLLGTVPIAPAVALGQRIGWRPAPNPNAIYEEESQYSYIGIVQEPGNPRARTMLLDRLAHSQVNMDDPLDLKYEYEWVYEAVIDKVYPARRPIRAFVIGGGGYAFPRYLEVARPGSQVEVAEIDPAVTEAAHAFFGLPRDTSIAVFNMDARNRVTDLIRKKAAGDEAPAFDCIFGDSINDYSVPYHLTTLEFTRQIHDLLADDGLYLLNLIDVYNSGAFLGAVTRTCRSCFPYVHVFNTGRPAQVRDTFIVVASKRALGLQDIAQRIQARYPYRGGLIDPKAIDEMSRRQGEMVLTDDYAPVEVLLKPVVHTRQKDPGEAHLELARREAAKGNIGKAIADCRAAIDIHPRWPEALLLLADLLERSGDVESAADALRRAAEYSEDKAAPSLRLGEFLLQYGRRDEGIAALRQAVSAAPNLASAHERLGIELLVSGDVTGALAELQSAAEITPDSLYTRYHLGLAHAALGQMEAAMAAWREALEIDATHRDSLYNLAVTAERLGQADVAAQYVARMQELGYELDDVLSRIQENAAQEAPPQ